MQAQRQEEQAARWRDEEEKGNGEKAPQCLRLEPPPPAVEWHCANLIRESLLGGPKRRVAVRTRSPLLDGGSSGIALGDRHRPAGYTQASKLSASVVGP